MIHPNALGMPAVATVTDRFAAIRRWWCDHRTAVLRLTLLLLAVCALLRLSSGYQSLLWDHNRMGAVDLRLRHRDVHAWFGGVPIYRVFSCADYPPASYALLWPLLGWLPITAARWFWALTLVPVLGALACLVVRESGARTLPERAFVALMLLAMTAIRSAIGNGQLILHLLPPLLAGLLLLHRGRAGWRVDLLAAALILVSLMKPTLSAPFFWLVLFLPGRLRPAVLVALGYGALTLLAGAFQQSPLPALLWDWRANSAATLADSGHTTLTRFLVFFGLQSWSLPAALLVLAALGAWTYRCRRADPWLLIGITAIVARLWIYHRSYDDLLILLPMVTLFRIAAREPRGSAAAVGAEMLLFATALVQLIPGNIVGMPAPGGYLVEVIFITSWGSVLLFLLDRVRREVPAPVRRAGLQPLLGG